jgi:hypothetical protein
MTAITRIVGESENSRVWGAGDNTTARVCVCRSVLKAPSTETAFVQ